LCVLREIRLDKARSEAIEAGRDGGVSRKQVADARCAECGLERPRVFLHEASGAFEHDERRMSLVEMADFWFDSETAKEAPAADPEHQLLCQAQLRPTAVEFAGDTAVGWLVRRSLLSSRYSFSRPTCACQARSQ